MSAGEAGVDALAAKGVKFGKSGGEVREVWVYDGVKLTPEDFQIIAGLPAVRTLFLRQLTRQLDDEMLVVLGEKPTVTNLSTNMATVSDDGLRHLATWTALEKLSLIHWGWANGWRPFPDKSTVIGQGLKHLAALPALKSLDLGGARIDDSALTAVATLTTLDEVRLFHAVAVGDDGVAKLAALPKLARIQLGSVRFSDRTVEILSRMPTLTDIELDEVILTWDGGLTHLTRLPALKKLTLKNVTLSEADLSQLKSALPQVTVTWNAPDEKTLAKLTAERARLAKKSGKP
jgi:hypothetical protein